MGFTIASPQPQQPQPKPAPNYGRLTPYSTVYSQYEKQYGLPEGTLMHIAGIESTYGSDLVNDNSTARGPFQFINSTRDQYGLDAKSVMDPLASGDAAARLARDNAAALKQKLGRDPTIGELYLAHQQGSGGAAKLLANPTALASNLVGRKAVALNGGNPDTTTAEQFARLWLNKKPGVPASMDQPGPTVEAAAKQADPLIHLARDALKAASSGTDAFFDLTKGAAVAEGAAYSALMPAHAERMRSFAELYGEAPINPEAPGGGQGPSTQLGFGPNMPSAQAMMDPRQAIDPSTMSMGIPDSARPQLQLPGSPLNANPADYPTGTPADELVTSSVSGQPGSGGAAGAGAPGAPGEEKKTPWWKSDDFGNLMRGIGVGLGQMSAGQPVDLTQHYANIQADRLAAAQAIQNQDQEAYDRAMADRDYNLEVAKHQLNEKKANLDQTGVIVPMPEEEATRLAELYPQAAGALDMYQTAVRTGNAGLASSALEAIQQTIGREQKTNAPLNTDALIRFASATTPEDKAAALEGLSPEEQQGILEAAPSIEQDIGAFRQKAQDLVDADNRDNGGAEYGGSTHAAMQELLANDGGTNIDVNVPNLYAEAAAVEQGKIETRAAEEFRAEKLDKAVQADMIKPVIDDTIASTVAIINAGGDTSKLSGWVREAYEWANTAGLDAVVNRIGAMTGLDHQYLSQLDMDGARFMYALATHYKMTGQGFTEKEQQILLSMSASDMSTNEGRIRFLSRLQSENALDKAAAHLVRNENLGAENLTQVREKIALDMAPLHQVLTPYYASRIDLQIPSTGARDELAAIVDYYGTPDGDEQQAILDRMGWTEDQMAAKTRRYTPPMTLEQFRLLNAADPSIDVVLKSPPPAEGSPEALAGEFFYDVEDLK